MTSQLETQIENQAELVQEEIIASIQSLDAIKAKVTHVAMRRLTFGKTIDDWNKQLSLPIDPSADPARVKYYLSILAGNLDTAYRNLTAIKIMYHNYKLSYEPAVNAEVSAQANHKGRKVAPALETMNKVAENNLGDRSLAAIEFQGYIEFWTDMVWKIKDQIGIVKAIGMSNGTLYRVGEYAE